MGKQSAKELYEACDHRQTVAACLELIRESIHRLESKVTDIIHENKQGLCTQQTHVQAFVSTLEKVNEGNTKTHQIGRAHRCGQEPLQPPPHPILLHSLFTLILPDLPHLPP